MDYHRVSYQEYPFRGLKFLDLLAFLADTRLDDSRVSLGRLSSQGKDQGQQHSQRQ